MKKPCKANLAGPIWWSVLGLEPFTDGLNPPQAAAVGKPPSV